MGILINQMIVNTTIHIQNNQNEPVDLKWNTYINYSKEINDKDPKFKTGYFVRISKYKNIFAKIYLPNCPEEDFFITKFENTVPQTYVISHLKDEEIVGTFCKKELQRS